MMRSRVLSHPPSINPQIVHRQRMRFTCTTAAVNKVITVYNLLDTIFVATAAAVGYELFDQVKINHVEVWSTPALGAAPSTVAVQFGSGAAAVVGDARVYSDTSMGIEPGHVRCAPSPHAQVSQWQVLSNNLAFYLTCPVSSVIDVDLSFRVVQAQTPNNVQNVPVLAVVGEIYYRGLDGLALAGTTLPAVAPLSN